MSGPLTGLKVVELAGIGPGPFCGMLFADLGADVIRVERVGVPEKPQNFLARGRRSIAVDLKRAEGVEVVGRLVAKADALIEGFRPGVMERLGLGPAECLAQNPALVYGRMTGWGQYGPLAHSAGHDIDYIAIAGALHGLGDPDHPPTPPYNLVGDFGGGAMFLAFGMVSAILHTRWTGRGQVVDAAMTDGTALLMTMMHGMLSNGTWSDQRGLNLFDGSAPFYGCYECADGEYLAVGALEPHFTDELLSILGLADEPGLREHWYDCEHWPRLRERLAEVVRGRTRDEWAARLQGTDACAVPVLSLTEARQHPHNVARETFIEVDGYAHPAPAPRFSETPGRVRSGVPLPGAHTREVLAEIGYAEAAVRRLAAGGTVAW